MVAVEVVEEGKGKSQVEDRVEEKEKRKMKELVKMVSVEEKNKKAQRGMKVMGRSITAPGSKPSPEKVSDEIVLAPSGEAHV